MNCGALLIRCVGQILGQRTHTGRQAQEKQREREWESESVSRWERELHWNFPCNTPKHREYNKSDKQITRHKAAQSTSMLQVVFTICWISSARLSTADRADFLYFCKLPQIFERCLIGNIESSEKQLLIKKASLNFLPLLAYCQPSTPVLYLPLSLSLFVWVCVLWATVRHRHWPHSLTSCLCNPLGSRLNARHFVCLLCAMIAESPLEKVLWLRTGFDLTIPAQWLVLALLARVSASSGICANRGKTKITYCAHVHFSLRAACPLHHSLPLFLCQSGLASHAMQFFPGNKMNCPTGSGVCCAAAAQVLWYFGNYWLRLSGCGWQCRMLNAHYLLLFQWYFESATAERAEPSRVQQPNRTYIAIDECNLPLTMPCSGSYNKC